MTEPASAETGEAIAGNMSLVRDEIAVTTAKVDEQQVAALAHQLHEAPGCASPERVEAGWSCGWPRCG